MSRKNGRMHVPIRMCLGCGRREEQAALLRLTLTPQGNLCYDPYRRVGGRGGYLHRQPECWRAFCAARPIFIRSLRQVVTKAERKRMVELLRQQTNLSSEALDSEFCSQLLSQ